MTRTTLVSFWCGLLGLIVGCAEMAFAQEPPKPVEAAGPAPDPDPATTTKSSANQGGERPVKYRVALGSATGGGVYVYVKDRWGLLHVRLVNPQDRPLELLCATAIEGEETLQYGRRLWLPARSGLATWHPIRMPSTVSSEQKTVDFRMLMMEAGKSSESLIRDESGKMQLTGSLRTVDAKTTTSVLPPDEGPDGNAASVNESLSLLQEGRVSQGLNPRLSMLTDRVLPPVPEGYDALEQLVIANGRVTQDAAAITAMRSWLFEGGHLWVMLDKAGPDVLAALLGDDWSGEIVDRVGLNVVNIRGGPARGYSHSETAEFEKPVELVRLAAEGFNIEYTVNGWPAAMTKRCGAGQLLVTTLGPRGWLYSPDRINWENEPRPPQRQFAVNQAMESLAAEFFRLRAPAALPTAFAESYVSDQVGYTVPSRGLVLFLLAGFAAVVALAGYWLSRSDRPGVLWRYGLIAGGVVSSILILVGYRHHQSVPSTVASLQLVEPVSGTNAIRTSGTAALFSNSSGSARLGSQHGGLFFPDMAGHSGATRRMIWSDLDRWEWENLPQSIGLRTASFTTSMEMPDRMEAVASFDANGLAGRVTLPGNLNPTDGVVITTYGRVGATVEGNGRFVAQSDQTLSQTQFIASGLLSDEQLRRSRIIESLVVRKDGLAYPAQPTLFLWTKPWDVGFQFADSMQQTGAALVALPLRFERPADGTDVSVPPPLLPFREVSGPDGVRPSGWYDYRKREWNERLRQASCWLGFQLPDVVCPAESRQARLTIQVNGPVNRLLLEGLKDDRVVPLKTWLKPVGTVTFQIDDPDVIVPDSSGLVRLKLTGGEETPEDDTGRIDGTKRQSAWRVESLLFEWSGRTKTQ